MNSAASDLQRRYAAYLSQVSPLGERLYAVTGVQSRLVFDALHWKSPAADLMTSELEVHSEVGEMMDEGWRWTPEAAGEHPMEIRFHSTVESGREECYAMTLEVNDSHAWGTGRRLRWLPIGDSITATGTIQYAVVERAKSFGAEVITLGTQQGREIAAEMRHEGYPGWKFIDFLRRRTPEPGANPRKESEPPFLTGDALDFAAYLQEQLKDEEPDVITVSLGTNDIALLTGETLVSGVEEVIGCARQLISHLLETTKTAKIGIAAPILPAPGEQSFGRNYGCLIPQWRYRKNQHVIVRALFDAFHGSHERVSIIPVFAQVDPVTSYPMEEDRRTEHAPETRWIYSNSVHPTLAGAREMGDAIFGWMVAKTK